MKAPGLFCIFTLVLAAFGCVPSSKLLYKDELVEVTAKGIANLLNVHESHTRATIKIFGQTFDNVRGAAPFYLNLPQKDSILFVTGRTDDSSQATVHIAKLKTRDIESFPAYDSQIGRSIGRKNRTGSVETIESLTGDKLVIAAGFLDRRFRYFLDLRKLEFEKEEAIYPDSILGVTNEYVIPNGKRSERRGGPIVDLDFKPQP